MIRACGVRLSVSWAALVVFSLGCSRGTPPAPNQAPHKNASPNSAAKSPAPNVAPREVLSGEATQKSAKPAETAEHTLTRGVEWLLAQQGEDGGWHSTVYGQMRGGVGDTALALYALAQIKPGQLNPNELAAAQELAERGTTFLLEQLADPQHVERREGADYPTYAAALWLLSLKNSTSAGGSSPSKEQTTRVIEYLKSSQQTKAGGWKPDDPQFGGWNQTGGAAGDARRLGNTNISVTSFALSALAAHKALDNDASAAAQAFVARCQNFSDDPLKGDGGFFFLPEADDPLNKAGLQLGMTPPRPRSYGPPTADGLCALVASGVKRDDPRVRAAIAWLDQHDAIDRVPGFAEEEPDGASAADGLKFYYYAALARAMREFPDAKFAKRKPELIAEIIRQQRPNGSWQNGNKVMREDDPLIATSLAIAALAMLTGN